MYRSPLACMSFFSHRMPPDMPLIAERAFDKDQSLYLLSLQQMIDNDYPIPSYMPDVFDKPDSWVETPQAVSESILLLSHERQRSRLYAVDCEMARHHFSTTRPTQPDTVSDRRRQGTDPGLHHRLRVRHCRVR
jgi:hypothetical protein